MQTRWEKIAALLSVALLSMSPLMAATHDHGHSHDTEEKAQLTLNDGKKWATDDSLRQGMNRIHDALAAELPAIHSGKATPAQYHALAQKTNEQIALMVKNCKLDQQADGMLHLILSDIIAGSKAMLTQDSKAARKGAEKMVRALDNYGTYFDHPGWPGVKPHQ